MSGVSLKGIRNWAIKTVKKKFPEIEISASGGIYSKEDIIEAKIFGAQTFQICSWVLRSGLNVLKKVQLEKVEERTKRTMAKIGQEDTILSNRRVKWEKIKCCRCAQCLQTFYCDAFINKYLFYNLNSPLFYTIG